MILETERLYLRPFRLTDTNDIASYSYREEFWRYIPIPPQARESAAEFVAKRVAGGQPDEGGNWNFAAELKSANQVVGTFRIGKLNHEAGSADLGYGVNPSFWGQGLATEGAAALLKFGFTELKLHRIWAIADIDNTPSQHVMEKLRMRREGVLREHQLVRGDWRTSALYSILVHEFAQ